MNKLSGLFIFLLWASLQAWTPPQNGRKASYMNFQKLVFYNMGTSYYLVVYSTDSSTTGASYDRFNAGIVLEQKDGKKLTIANEDLSITNLGDMVRDDSGKYTLFRFNLVIDNSGSIDSSSRNHIQSALSRFIQRLPKAFDAQVIKFADGIQAKSNFIKDKNQLVQLINQPHMPGGTALFNAIDLGVTELQYSDGDVPFKFSVVLTDGMDNSSNQSPDIFRSKIINKCKSNFIPLFVVGITDSVDEALLRSISEFGYYHHVSKFPDVDKAFDAIEGIIKNTFIFRIPGLSSYDQLKNVYIVHNESNGKLKTIQDIPVH